MNSKTIMALINTLQDCKSFAPENPVDISVALRRWQIAENYDATTISICDAVGQTIYDSIDEIYTRYADIRIDESGHYYAVDEPAYLTALRLLGESMDCTSISRVALLDCLSTYWPDFMWISESYDILIVLAESLRYYEEQIFEYTQIASDLMQATNDN